MPVTRATLKVLEELFAIRGYPPPPVPPPQPLDFRYHLNLLSTWDKTFSRALDSLLETTWFTSPQGTNLVLGDHPDKDVELEWEFANFLLTSSGQVRYGDITIPSREARLVWRLAQTCHVAVSTEIFGQCPPKDDAALASSRVRVLTALLTGERLTDNPLCPSDVYGTAQLQEMSVEAQLQEHELEFWFNLGQFTTTLPVNNSFVIYDAELAELSCENMRRVLETYENRDTLYSIAMCRHVGEQSWRGIILTERERADYFVARGFVERQRVQASTRVMRIICKMAANIWEE